LNKGDQLIERGAARLDKLSRQAAAKGGFSAKLADGLADDAAFLRKLKPSLIAARARGEAPTNQEPSPQRRVRESDLMEGTPAPSDQEVPPASDAKRAPTGPQITTNRRPKTKSGRGGKGPNPFVVAGIAVAAGIALAKLIDWRSHAHPRD
jgi:hypothetical protein